MKFIGLILIALLAGCGPSQEEARQEKLDKLESIRLETVANLHRHVAECQAVAIEFKGDRAMVDNCLETHRTMIDIAQRTFSDIDKRIAEINEIGR